MKTLNSTPFDDIRNFSRRVTRYAEVFQAFHDLFSSKTSVELALSESGTNGLAFIFQLLSDDADETAVDLCCVVNALGKERESHE